MKTSLRIATTLCIISLVATLAPTTAVGQVSSVDNACWKYKSSERGFARKMNGARVLEDLTKLLLEPDLSKAATKHTQEMWKRNELYHTPSDKLRNPVTHWTIIGENVGVRGTVS